MNFNPDQYTSIVQQSPLTEKAPEGMSQIMEKTS